MNVKNSFVQLANKKQVFITLLFVFLCMHCIGGSLTAHFRYLKSILLFVGFMFLILSEKKMLNPYVWGVFFSILLLDIITKYYQISNHHFLLAYLTLAVLFYTKGVYTFEVLVKNTNYLLIIVIGSAALQKLFTHQFISGEYYYYMFHMGGFFNPFINYNSEAMEIINANVSAIENLELMDPNNSHAITLRKLHPNIKLLSILFAWITILFEFLIAFLLWSKPKSNITQILLIVLIIGIFMTRLETGFLSILSILLYAISATKKTQLIAVLLTLFLFALTISGIGHY